MRGKEAEDIVVAHFQNGGIPFVILRTADDLRPDQVKFRIEPHQTRENNFNQKNKKATNE